MPQRDRKQFTRTPGLLILGGLVVLGMGVPVYYLWSVPRLEARAASIRAAAPTDPEGRVGMWFEFGQPKIHHALVQARFGAIIEDERVNGRNVSVDVRVGDYSFDSHPGPEDQDLFGELEGFRPSNQAPVDDDPGALQATLWLLTDRAYKKALSTYLRKQARKVTTVKDKHIDSFSKEKPLTHQDDPQRLRSRG